MLSLNTQPVEKPVSRGDGALDVVDIWLTIQGEGPLAGEPAVFIRLAGCNLDCSFCDTNYTTGRRLLSLAQLSDAVKIAVEGRPIDLIVLTGGEPFRQDLRPFICEAIRQNHRVQIETNGTIHQDLPYGEPRDAWKLLWVVCSPKTPKVAPELIPRIDAWKYVLDADHVDPYDGLPTGVLGADLPPARPPSDNVVEVFVQPMDMGDPVENQRHLKAVLDSCMKFGYRLSLQQHKIIGLL